MNAKEILIIWATEQELKHPEWADAMAELRNSADFIQFEFVRAQTNAMFSRHAEDLKNIARSFL